MSGAARLGKVPTRAPDSFVPIERRVTREWTQRIYRLRVDRHGRHVTTVVAVRSFDLWLVSALDDGPCRVDWHAPYAPSATN